MGRWGVVVGCAVLAACGGSSGGRAGEGADSGSPGVDGGGPDAGDSGVPGERDGGVPGPDAGSVDGGPTSDGGAASCIPPPVPEACALNPVLGAPQTFQVTLSSNDGSDGGYPYTDLCDAVLPSDGEGRILVRVNHRTDIYPDEAAVYVLPTDAGAPPVYIGPPVGAFPLESGWVLAANQESINGHVYGLDFAVLSPPDQLRTALSIGLPVWVARGPNGGIAAAGPQAGMTPCPAGSGDEFRIGVERFSPDGTESARTELGCVFDEHSLYSLGLNAQGDVIALLPDAGWHVAPDGKISTFSAIAPGQLQPLTDGRFARKDWDSVAWSATISVDGGVSPPPCWLAERPDVSGLQIVLGGKAYLAYHDTSSIYQRDGTASCDRYAELILANGSSCGFIPLSGTDGGCNHSVVNVGLDGTLTTLDQRTCTVSAWPGAFR